METEASAYAVPHTTVVYSMMAHWLGEAETARFAGLARRNFGIVFRLPNPGYVVPINGSWFPTFGQLDAVVGGVRTSETHLETQDNDKQIWAATYRTDFTVRDGWIRKSGIGLRGLTALLQAGAPIVAELDLGGVWMPIYGGTDLHGDPPFRHRHGRPIIHHPAVDRLAAGLARAALASGFVPLDFSPRNIIVNEDGAHLVDLGEIERHDGTIPEPYRTIWETTLGRPFSGRLADLA
jgi:hypothetical protein